MNTEEIELLLEYISNIILNKPTPKERLPQDSQESINLQEALNYLSDCLRESNSFLNSICKGELNAVTPSRHNFLAGNLKEIHSVLKHLAWQTIQVANGDYAQRVGFLGEFSEAFNIMIMQLEEREWQLKEQSVVLTQSMELLTSIIETHNDGIIVTDALDYKLLYKNKANTDEYNHSPQIINHTKLVMSTGNMYQMVYPCTTSDKYYEIKSFPIQWKEKQAVAHYIMDVTRLENEKQSLSEYAFKDSLTGIFNHRFCEQKIDEYLSLKNEFSIVSVDINNLKLVNDKYGHSEGDNYIKTVVDIMNSHIRETDYACRVGGDEFILLLNHCTDEIATQKLECIFSDIVKLSQQYNMSISYGITYADKDNTMTHEELINSCDEKMYIFKQEYKKSLSKES